MSENKVFNESYLKGNVDYMINLAIDRLKEDLSKRKSDLIKLKLIQIGKEELHSDCRFKQLSSHIDRDSIERWYYNDGTPEGKLLISFYPPDVGFIENAIRATFKYE